MHPRLSAGIHPIAHSLRVRRRRLTSKKKLKFLDKSTINYAALFGFKQDLKLQGNQYSLLGSIFYLGFLAYQLPNNYLLQRIPVGRYIGVVAMIWGAILACTAAGRNFSQVAAMRFLLGLFEGIPI